MLHQNIDYLGEALKSVCETKEGEIEAIAHKTLPIFAVQWHPEEIYDEYSIKKNNKFIRRRVI